MNDESRYGSNTVSFKDSEGNIPMSGLIVYKVQRDLYENKGNFEKLETLEIVDDVIDKLTYLDVKDML